MHVVTFSKWKSKGVSEVLHELLGVCEKNSKYTSFKTQGSCVFLCNVVKGAKPTDVSTTSPAVQWHWFLMNIKRKFSK